MKETIVLYPAPGCHHMVTMIDLSKLIFKLLPNHNITVLVPSTPFDTCHPSSINNSNPMLSFFRLPPIHQNSSTKPLTTFECVRLMAPQVVEAMNAISLQSKLLCLITTAIHPSYHPTIPTYHYYTSCAASLATMLYIPTIHARTTKSFKDLDQDTLLDIPGLTVPVKPCYLPQFIHDRNDPSYDEFLNYFRCLPVANGIIVNTIELLEPQAIKALTRGDCVTNGETPPLYCLGPLVIGAKERVTGGDGPRDMMDRGSFALEWLDSQPTRSVLFMCFGSKNVSFSATQLKEIAIGLERSNQRFLWVVKNPPPDTKADPNLDQLLPEGFLERTKEKGLVVKSYAPQADILNHKSVGGFVTHCGWNSVLEAISNGVPMVAWPMYAEQHINSVGMVEDMKVAIPIISSGEKDEFVSADKVEKRVRELMGEEGKELRERCLEVKEMGVGAWSHGGSSFNVFSKLVASWKEDKSKWNFI